jgi:hypothetical protein
MDRAAFAFPAVGDVLFPLVCLTGTKLSSSITAALVVLGADETGNGIFWHGLGDIFASVTRR